MSLDGKIALVTGASRGIGRGIALQLGAAGATVYITGRPPKSSSSAQQSLPDLKKTANEINERGGKGIPVYCDHSDMDEVAKLFKQIESETAGALDILVNNAYSAIQTLADVAGLSFWECDPDVWDSVNNVGLRNHYYCCVYAARLMVRRKMGFIVNISSFGGFKYLFNVAYGIGKCAMDRMAADMAIELRKHNVAMISLYPGVVRTELFGGLLEEGKLDKTIGGENLHELATESPEYAGKAIVALASDPKIMKKSGRTVLAADAGIDYNFKDVDGKEPSSIRSLRTLLAMQHLPYIPNFFPPWLRLPGWVITAVNSRL